MPLEGSAVICTFPPDPGRSGRAADTANNPTAVSVSGFRTQFVAGRDMMVRFNQMRILALLGCLSMLAGSVHSETEKGYIVLTNIGSTASNGDLSAANANTGVSRSSIYASLVNRAKQAADPMNVEAVTAGDPTAGILYVYEEVTEGFSVRLKKTVAAILKSMPGVLHVLEDEKHEASTTHTPKFLGLTSGQLWPLSKAGKDVIVGVLDSGVWPESASFSDVGMGPVPARWKGICQAGTKFTKANCNKKLIGARYFYKGHEAGENKPIDQSVFLLSPRDTSGHGTHCASTAAGSPVAGASLNGLGKGDAARGMAYGARVAVYKVCWKACYGSDIIAAYDEAVKDGVDVISVSIGGRPLQLIEEANSIGSFGAMRKGIFVTNSAGNSGGLAGTVSNIAPWVMTVGASTVDRAFFAIVKLGNGVVLRGKSWTPGNWGPATRPLVLGSDAAATNAISVLAENCVAGTLSAAKVAGKIVVCRNQLGNSLDSKGMEVLAKGGRGMIIVDSTDLVDTNSVHHVLPAVHLPFVDSDVLLEKYMAATANPTAVLLPSTVVGVKPAPVVAYFSSRGPSSINPQILKPDVVAPGVDILAAWTGHVAATKLAADLNRVKFNVISGTSMATPHVAGLGALLRAVYPKWSPAMIKSALMTTATVYDNRLKRLTDQWTSGAVASPFDYGAGHVAPEKALNPGLVYDLTVKDYINYLCGSGHTLEQVKVFAGNSEPVTCPKIPMKAVDFNYPTFSVTFTPSIKSLSVTFTRTVTNVGPAISKYTAVVSAQTGVVITVSPKTLSFTAAQKTRSFTVTVKTTGAPVRATALLTWTDGKHFVQSPIVITPA